MEHEMAFDAIVRKLELIGEAASHVPQEIRENYPEIPWRRIIGLRNTLIHGYFSLDDGILWSVTRDDVPELLESLQRLIQHE